MQAALKVYSGTEWLRVVGRIVRTWASGATTIETEDGIRWTATADKTTLVAGGKLEDNGLW